MYNLHYFYRLQHTTQVQSKTIATSLAAVSILTLCALTTLSGISLQLAIRTTEHSDPEKVASAYIRLMHREEYAKVKQISTPESHSVLDLFIALSPAVDDALDVLTGAGSVTGAAAEVETDEISFTILRTQIDGDTAYVFYIEQDYAAEEESVMLKFVDGQWLIHIGKEDVFEEDFDALPYDTDNFDAAEEWPDWDYKEEARLANLFGEASEGFVNAWNAGDFSTASNYTNQEMTQFLTERAAGQHVDYPNRLEIVKAKFDTMKGPFDFICATPGSNEQWVFRLVLSSAGDEVHVISLTRAHNE